MRHSTRHHYSEPVQLREHRMMFRPRKSHDLRFVTTSLVILPLPAELRWRRRFAHSTLPLASSAGICSCAQDHLTERLDPGESGLARAASNSTGKRCAIGYTRDRTSAPTMVTVGQPSEST
jgi:hypothetical protein